MSNPLSTTEEAKFSISAYNNRAPGYDAGNGGWHIGLGRDFVEWIKPVSGAKVLDLACGTGLVSLPAAEAVGSSGTVIGVDISSGMLAEARKKPVKEGSAPITWIEHDVTSLSFVEPVQSIVKQDGGFDIITCCSALVLLPDQPGAIKHWATLLKSGGKMIIDVPTEDKTPQDLFTIDLRNALGIGLPFDRSWVKDVHSLDKLYKEAGLTVESSWRTKSYTPMKIYDEHQKDNVFESHRSSVHKSFLELEEDKLQEARKAWESIWKENLKDGKLVDGHPLYLTIGRKP